MDDRGTLFLVLKTNGKLEKRQLAVIQRCRVTAATFRLQMLVFLLFSANITYYT